MFQKLCTFCVALSPPLEYIVVVWFVEIRWISAGLSNGLRMAKSPMHNVKLQILDLLVSKSFPRHYKFL